MILYIIRSISWKWRVNSNGTTINRVGGWSSPQCSFLVLDDRPHHPLRIITGHPFMGKSSAIFSHDRRYCAY
ncbi:uncharacterized protein Bfra_011435 [Botrytis fragariae]|uniref:Uncharacterized protein n=1 Tax=Botrytis fragariae TaxID=1964551 RepID=A0A8H6EKK9_9HELO|nr:uncharacterized protein Bfra_011435 [Botrytis fragariae]KAF5875673.1 hypothetical protein Bfra_011435 [Botrytis fragariae]